MACLVTYVNSRVLGPADQTEHYTLKGVGRDYGSNSLLRAFNSSAHRHR